MDASTNERMTRVGPGTPGGELLRRFWQPLCPAAEITEANPKKRLRILGEDLLVFRDAQGNIACIEEHCKHRGTSLYYGFIEESGLRCAYHGWVYDVKGQCREMPFETHNERFKEKIRLKSYPVRKLGGLLFAYLGPNPDQAPLLPRWDVLVREDGKRSIQVFPTHHCNWVQIQENTADSTHTFFLHGMMDKELKTNHPFAAYYRRPIVRAEFKPSEWGLDKVIEYGGSVPEVEVRPPLIFPNILRIPNGPNEVIHWRVPIDDVSTRIIFLAFTPSKDGSVRTPEEADVPYTYDPEMKTPDGEYKLDSFFSQDQMAMETQGAIYDRTKENLGGSDQGIVRYRRLLLEQIQRVEGGQEPSVGVVRDAERNRMIDFPGITSPVNTAALVKAAEAEQAAGR